MSNEGTLVKVLDSEHFALILRAIELMTSSLNMQEILDRLMDQVIEVINAKRGFILMRESVNDEWQFRSTRHIDQGELHEEDFRVSRGVLDRVAQQGKTILTADALQDERFKDRSSIVIHQMRSILCVPIVIKGEVLGVIYADQQEKSRVFGLKEKVVMEFIARQAAIALENARLYEKLKRIHEESMEQARKELKETQAQLFQTSKMAAVGLLASGIAHEINNPLGAIAMNVSLAKKLFTDDRLHTLLDIVETAIFDCKKIIEKLLCFSRQSSDIFQKVDMIGIVEDTLLLLKHQLEKDMIRVEKFFEDGIFMMGDRSEFSQVIMNILLNAKDALKKVPEDRERIIVIKIFGRDKRVFIEIKDNGTGMEDSVKERIFEPFFTTKNVGEGVGLGLSVSFQIVKKYNGEISVDSSPGNGTAFILSFPRVE